MVAKIGQRGVVYEFLKRFESKEFNNSYLNFLFQLWQFRECDRVADFQQLSFFIAKPDFNSFFLQT